MRSETALPDAAYALALAELPGMGPATLAGLLDGASPSEAWEAVRAGRARRPRGRGVADGGEQLTLGGDAGANGRRSWQEVAQHRDVAARWRRADAAGIGVTWRGHPRFPAVLDQDPEPPGVLFWRGRLEALERPCVAVVGTRHASLDGRRVAFELGRDLARGGVGVVSGLALGIDGAAHRGALDAAASPSIGVAASGVDVAYPRRHTGLWGEMVSSGVILSETPPGRPAQAWRFPARNRIIAALARLVVVVESGDVGGSMLTVEAALRRGVEVGAVPGPVHSPASQGTNRLLFEGAAPIRSAADVLGTPGVVPAPSAGGGGAGAGGSRRRAVEGERGCVLDAVGWTPTALAEVADRAGGALDAVVEALEWLEEEGWVTAEGGWWARRA